MTVGKLLKLLSYGEKYEYSIVIATISQKSILETTLKACSRMLRNSTRKYKNKQRSKIQSSYSRYSANERINDNFFSGLEDYLKEPTDDFVFIP